MRDDRAVHRGAQAAGERADLLLGHHRLVRERPAATAVLDRDGRAEQPELAGLVPHLAIDVLLLVPALLVRRALLLEERAREVAERFDIVIAPRGTNCGHREHLPSGLTYPTVTRDTGC